MSHNVCMCVYICMYNMCIFLNICIYSHVQVLSMRFGIWNVVNVLLLGLSAEKSGRKSGVQRRCSTRRSVANKSRMSLL